MESRCVLAAPHREGRIFGTMIRLLLVLVFLIVGSGAGPSVATAFQGGAGSDKTINVELIVDASGSMAAETNTGE